jgi:hypothetical protein
MGILGTLIGAGLSTAAKYATSKKTTNKTKRTSTPTTRYSNSSSGGNSRGDYSIGSDAGQEIANNMSIGQTHNASDGSTWIKNADGSISVTQKDGFFTKNAYQSNAQQNSYQTYQTPTSYMDVQAEQDRLIQKQNEEARKLYESYVQQGTDRLNTQRSDVDKTYNDASRSAYINYMQNQRALPQQLATAGITGGAAESSMIQSQSNYQSSLNSVNEQRAKAMNDINTAITDLKNSGNLQLAQTLMQNAEKIADNYAQNAYAEIARNDTLAQQAKQNAYNDAVLTGIYNGNPTLDAQQIAYAKQQDIYNKALALLDRGLSNDQIAATLGISRQEADRLVALAKQKAN